MKYLNMYSSVPKEINDLEHKCIRVHSQSHIIWVSLEYACN